MAEKSKEEIFALAKKYSNKKTILSSLSFVIVLAISVLSSVPEFMIDPTQVFTSRFITKLLMTLIIGVTSLVCFIMIGGNNNALNEASEIYKARSVFRASVEKVIPKYGAFKQWVERKRRPQKQREVNLRVLRSVGITNPLYLDLDINDLRDLVKAPNKELAKQYGVRQITEDQYNTILAIKEGKYAMKHLNINDYLYEKTIGIDETDEEMLVKQYKKRTLMFTENISSKMLFTIVIAVVLGVIGWSTADNIGQDMTPAQRAFTIIWDILSKLATATTSAMMGYYDGGKFNDFDARYLQVKTNVHTQFLGDTEFVVKTDKELAMEEYVKYHQKQEEAERKRLGLSDVNVLPAPKEDETESKTEETSQTKSDTGEIQSTPGGEKSEDSSGAEEV